MISPADFWGSIRPSGLTAEQELVELWARLRDCNRDSGGIWRARNALRRQLEHQQALDLARRALKAAEEAARVAEIEAEARKAERITLIGIRERAAAQRRLGEALAAVSGAQKVLAEAENEFQRAAAAPAQAILTIPALPGASDADRRGKDNRRRAALLAALLAFDA